MMPTTIILGANRAGSTSLHKLFLKHPDAHTSPIEPYFWEDGNEYAGGTSAYATIYGQGEPEQMIEVAKRPQLLLLPWTVARVQSSCPNAKFVVVLRDPVERMFSQWALRTLIGREPAAFSPLAIACLQDWEQNGNVLLAPGAEAAWTATLLRQPRFCTFNYYLAAGRYAENLIRWFAVFPRERFLILTLDQLETDTGNIAMQVYTHAGLDPARGLPVVPHANSYKIRNGGNGLTRPAPGIVTMLRDFYAASDSALATLLGWSDCPWTIMPEDGSLG